MVVTKDDITALKKIILSDDFPDRDDRTELDRRADVNRSFGTGSTRIIKETELVRKLLVSLKQFRSPDISRLIDFIKRSGLDEKLIASDILELLRKENNKFSAYQKAELINYVIGVIPDEIEIDLIKSSLQQLIASDPWLYASFLSAKDHEAALKFALHLISSGIQDASSFLVLLMQWIEEENVDFIYRSFGSVMGEIEKDPEIVEVLDFKLREKGLSLLDIRKKNVGWTTERQPILTRRPTFYGFNKAVRRGDPSWRKGN